MKKALFLLDYPSPLKLGQNTHHIKITILTILMCTIPTACSSFTGLCNHHLSLIAQHFITWGGDPVPASTHSPSLPLLLATTHLLSVSKDLPVLDISRVSGSHHLAWCVHGS